MNVFDIAEENGENHMLNMFEVIETNNMIEQEKLDVRTITMGISSQEG